MYQVYINCPAIKKWGKTQKRRIVVLPINNIDKDVRKKEMEGEKSYTKKIFTILYGICIIIVIPTRL